MDTNNNFVEGVSCVILVGGESRRIGSDKAQIEFNGRQLFSHVFEKVSPLFEDIMISAHDGKYPIDALEKIKEARLITDSSNGRGPALGLCSALAEASNDWVFMTACDQPLIEPALIRHLVTLKDGFDCVVPVTNGKTQSLFALYKKTCLEALSERISKAETKKGRSLYGFLEETDGLKVRYVKEEELKEADPALKSFIDIDTLEELSELEKNIKEDA